ncbi:cytochrome c biogenesis CcdA family protein [Longirhabdus pacifica]|uniref:cytochrome c biogenesis CcdA family protein n=1 Tax=Longirhabdus pacifica TaxID=2305227 RepID=UPI001008EE69|nr:cytochrome c biogenesis protein CcdA [Longirhabdus pacifica]
MDLNIWVAFWAGVISFISPCTLPLFPSYISYITGISVNDLKTKQTKEMRVKTMVHTLFFVAGLCVVFFTLGAAAGIVGGFFKQYSTLISQLAAILMIVMGLILLGVLKPKMLMREMKLNIKKPAGYFGTFAVGIGFAAGWSPCIGPILSGIIALASTDPGNWFYLMLSYSLGFSLPFIGLAFFIGSTKWILRYSDKVMKVGGVFMIVFGVLLYSGQLTKLTIFLQSITPEWMLF